MDLWRLIYLYAIPGKKFEISWLHPRTLQMQHFNGYKNDAHSMRALLDTVRQAGPYGPQIAIEEDDVFPSPLMIHSLDTPAPEVPRHDICPVPHPKHGNTVSNACYYRCPVCRRHYQQYTFNRHPCVRKGYVVILDSNSMYCCCPHPDCRNRDPLKLKEIF